MPPALTPLWQNFPKRDVILRIDARNPQALETNRSLPTLLMVIGRISRHSWPPKSNGRTVFGQTSLTVRLSTKIA